MADVYEKRSYAQVPIGFGHRPGIVVVDYQVAGLTRRWRSRRGAARMNARRPVGLRPPAPPRAGARYP